MRPDHDVPAQRARAHALGAKSLMLGEATSAMRRFPMEDSCASSRFRDKHVEVRFATACEGELRLWTSGMGFRGRLQGDGGCV